MIFGEESDRYHLEVVDRQCGAEPSMRGVVSAPGISPCQGSTNRAQPSVPVPVGSGGQRHGEGTRRRTLVASLDENLMPRLSCSSQRPASCDWAMSPRLTGPLPPPLRDYYGGGTLGP